MSNIYLKVTIQMFFWVWFSGFKKFTTTLVFEEIQLIQISLNFKTSCCNLKIRDLGAKLYAAFLLFSFWKELWRSKVKESMYFVEQKINVNKNETESKMENPTHSFREPNLLLRLI